jgi:hypothetical protein
MILGVGVQGGYGEPNMSRAASPVKPNVVVLNSEKRITLHEPSLTLTGLAAALEKQTTRTFVLEKSYRDDRTPYAALLSGTPLNRVLDAIAYVSGGRWERKGRTYTLKVPTADEVARDGVRYGAALQDLNEYLASIDVNDPTLPPSVGRCLDRFRRAMADPTIQSGSLSPFPEDAMRDWTVSAGSRGLGISWMSVTKDGDKETGNWINRSWGWGDAKR